MRFGPAGNDRQVDAIEVVRVLRIKGVEERPAVRAEARIERPVIGVDGRVRIACELGDHLAAGREEVEVGEVCLPPHRNELIVGCRAHLSPTAFRSDLCKRTVLEPVDRAGLDHIHGAWHRRRRNLVWAVHRLGVAFQVADRVIDPDAKTQHGKHQARCDRPAHQENDLCTSGRIWFQSGSRTLWPATQPSDVYGGTSTMRWTLGPLKSLAIEISARALSRPMLVLISPLKAPASEGRSAALRCAASALIESRSCCCRSDLAKSPRASPCRERTY